MITPDWIEDEAELANVVVEIANRRKELGISQREVAYEMCTTQGVVSSIELLKYNVRVSTLMLYARCMGKSLKLTLKDLNE